MYPESLNLESNTSVAEDWFVWWRVFTANTGHRSFIYYLLQYITWSQIVTTLLCQDDWTPSNIKKLTILRDETKSLNFFRLIVLNWHLDRRRLHAPNRNWLSLRNSISEVRTLPWTDVLGSRCVCNAVWRSVRTAHAALDVFTTPYLPLEAN